LLVRGSAVILDVVVENDLLSIRIDGLKRIDGPSDLGDFHYVPMLFGEGGKLRPLQKRILEVCGPVFGEIPGRPPGKGILVHPEQSSFDGVRLDANMRATRTLFRGLRELRDACVSPELILNSHCPICQFQQSCRTRASAADNLSLLRGMGEKE